MVIEAQKAGSLFENGGAVSTSSRVRRETMTGNTVQVRSQCRASGVLASCPKAEERKLASAYHITERGGVRVRDSPAAYPLTAGSALSTSGGHAAYWRDWRREQICGGRERWLWSWLENWLAALDGKQQMLMQSGRSAWGRPERPGSRRGW